jgi:hypothetical protein
MSNPTSNFGWQMPTATDLVTDLPADFEVFGQAVDTDFVDLLGGTTGQILSKTSATDLDFTWINNDQGDITGVTAGTGISGGGTSGTVTITNSMATEIAAKGDLIVGTGSATFDNLTAGSNGETLVADSSTSTGLRYQGNNAAGKNAVINGDCLVAQRGTSALTLSATAQYPVDRFFAVGHSGATAQQITSISNTSFKNAVRVQRTAANSTTTDLSFTQTFETNTSIPFQGKAVTISFWARAGANFSPTSSTLTSRVYTGTGTDQGGFGFSWTGTANPINQGNTLTTSWQRFTATGTISSSATQIQVFFFCTPVGTAGAADYFDITGVQLEAGSVATAFQTATGTIQGELAACQRYYWRASAAATSNVLSTMGTAYNTSGVIMSWQNPVPMRVKASSIDYSALEVADFVNAGVGITSASADGNSTPSNSMSVIGVSGTPLTQYRNYAVRSSSSSGYVGFSAEL